MNKVGFENGNMSLALPYTFLVWLLNWRYSGFARQMEISLISVIRCM
ncbi:MAG: hypothetical protein PUG18_00650 [Lachnospiraceae bacterium]|nr:hypothetical protein [Lachnospiraceae bacterium]